MHADIIQEHNLTHTK